jgi:TM2 domain-containing membrane protein YozV
MNEKLRNHGNILFAAAPKTAKAEEVKEELLTTLNDKYNDLLAGGYDSTAAFHLALSGIGDIDELFKECGGPARAETPAEPPSDFVKSASAAISRVSKMPNSSLVLLAVVLIAAGIMGPWSFGWEIRHGGSFVFVGLMRIVCLTCWAVGIGLIIYIVIRNVTKDESPSAEPWTPPPPSPTPVSSVQFNSVNPITREEIAFKRIVAGVLAILLGAFGIHKFYLGFIWTGLFMLCITILSLGILYPVTAIIGFVEGLLYLLKSDRDFYRDYEVGRRNWF